MSKNPTHVYEPISNQLDINVEKFNKILGIDVGFDIGCRQMEVAGRDAAIYYINGFTKDLDLLQIFRDLDSCKDKCQKMDLEELVKYHLNYLQVEIVNDTQTILYHLLSGRIILFFDGFEQAIAIEARQFAGRSPDEPELERVVRGSRDGFTESLVTNTSLIRRRLRDPGLRFELFKLGRRSQSDVVIAYIKDITNPGLIDNIKKRINSFDIDGLPMGEKAVEEFLTRNDWNPLPKVRFTERPDVAAMHLLEGHVLIMVDTSPSIIIAPATFFHHLEHAEEYRQNAMFGIYMRIVRYAAVFASILLLPLWVLVSLNPGLLPPVLAFIGPKEQGSVPLLLQVVVAEFGLDMVRMAAIHTPSPLATALGLIAAFMIGQVAIDVGLFNAEIILYLAAAAVGTFATPSYELGNANRLIRLFLILLVGVFNLVGLVVGLVAVFVLLLSTKSFGIPYLSPLLPPIPRDMVGTLIRTPVPTKKMRPKILDPIDQTRQPVKNEKKTEAVQRKYRSLNRHLKTR